MYQHTIKRERIDNCGFIKMVLMLSVVLCHSVSFFGGTWFTAYTPMQKVKSLIILSGYTGSFHVYCFTLVSGYLFYFLKVELGKYQLYKDFIYKKIKRLLIPYLFASIVWVVPVSWLFFRFTLKEVLSKYVLCVNPSQLWFLWMLFWVFVIYWPISKHFYGRDSFRIAISLILFVIGTVGKHYLPNLFNILTACQYVIFFEAGYLIRKRDEQLNQGQLLIVSIIIHASLFVGRYVIVLPKYIDIIDQLILHLAGAIAVFEVLQYIATKVQSNNRIIADLTVYSMPIYLFHQQFVYIVIALTNGYINPYLIAISSFIISIISSIIMSKLFMKMKYGILFVGMSNT